MVTIDESLPGRPSVVGVARGTGGGAALMLNAHIDTVGVAGMTRPHEPAVRDGRLHGRGAYDMKGGLAAIMLAGAAVAGAGLRGDVLVTAVADEEHASAGVQSVLRRFGADACVVTEPTSLRACVAHKGFVWAELETRGRAAHGSRPDLGVDAIAGLAPVLAGLRALQVRLAQRAHPLLGPASIHASLDRRRAGAVQLPRALRPVGRAPDAPGRDGRRRRARARRAAGARPGRGPAHRDGAADRACP